MKRIVFFCVFSVLLCVGFACTSGKPIHSEPVVQDDQLQVFKDSVSCLNVKVDQLTFMAATYETYLVAYENDRMATADSICVLNDSINSLNARPLMTKTQFIDLYRYERVKKYYRICVNNPTQWKFIKGWLKRAIEE